MPRAKAAPVGKVAGQFHVSNLGAAQYSVKIETPPGRAGVEPTLALAYDSDSGNGLLGMGFSLSGLSRIERCGSTYRSDGALHQVTLTKRDNFCLDGALLVPTDGEKGMPNTRYRTTPDTFAQIQSMGSISPDKPELGPRSFTVRTKDGRILEYGGGAQTDEPTARILASNGAVRIWALSRVSDRSGNYFTIAYNRTPDEGNTYTAEWSPDEIRYTGNAGAGKPADRVVKFLYQSRPDPMTAYLAGMKLTTTQRLSRIRTYEPRDGWVREYRLEYEDNQPHLTGRSRISTISECGFPDLSELVACKPPTTFRWSDSAAGGQAESYYQAREV